MKFMRFRRHRSRRVAGGRWLLQNLVWNNDDKPLQPPPPRYSPVCCCATRYLMGADFHFHPLNFLSITSLPSLLFIRPLLPKTALAAKRYSRARARVCIRVRVYTHLPFPAFYTLALPSAEKTTRKRWTRRRHCTTPPPASNWNSRWISRAHCSW